MTSQHQGFLTMALGFAVWMAALAGLYGIQATGCEFAWQQTRFGPVSLLRAVLYGTIAASMGVLLWLLTYCVSKLAVSDGGGPNTFLWRASTYLTVASIAATAWIGTALLLPTICG